MRFIGNVEKDAQVRAVASGALSTGDTVVVNSDGTVSSVSETAVSEDTGTPVVFESADMLYTGTAYDSNSDRIVVMYRGIASGEGRGVVGEIDPSDNSISFGTPVSNGSNRNRMAATFDSVNNKIVFVNDTKVGVGTVDPSDNSISFGTPTDLPIAIQQPSITFDSSSGKVVIVARDSALDGKAFVGTVSGTSISLSSTITWDSGQVEDATVAFDSNNNKIVIVYRDEGNSNYGAALVGAVSGNSITFGSKVFFTSTAATDTVIAFDSSNNKMGVFYKDFVADDAKSVVGTVSGDSITFGSPVTFASSTPEPLAATFNATTGKLVVAIRQSSQGKVLAATISGTSMSFDTAQTFETGRPDTLSIAADTSTGRYVMSYEDDSNSDYGTSAVYNPAYNETNLTAENFIGFADSGYADGKSAAINSTCTVDRNQSGLTAGQKYYVQTNGALGTTAADPSVEAGTAISSTEIIVKG